MFQTSNFYLFFLLFFTFFKSEVFCISVFFDLPSEFVWYSIYSEISIGNFQHRPLKNQAYSKKSPQNYLYAYFPPTCITHFSRPPQTCQKNRPVMLISQNAYLWVNTVRCRHFLKFAAYIYNIIESGDLYRATPCIGPGQQKHEFRKNQTFGRSNMITI